MNEKEILQTEFEKPIILVTYTEPKQVQKSVKVRRYDLLVDTGTIVSKIDVLFAFEFGHYATLKAGIRVNEKVADQKLKPIPKPKDRPHVATQQEYKAGAGKHVKLTMRTGHILSGKQLANTQYNLFVNICDHTVLVYKHGILDYEVQPEGETDGIRTEE